MLLLLAPLAFADVAAPCQGGAPLDSLPATGAAGVPVDVAPVFTFSWGGCGDPTWTLVLADADRHVVARETDDVSDGLAELVLDEPLDPDTLYILTLADADRTDEHVVSFTTGHGSGGGGEPGVPALYGLSATWDEATDVLAVDASASPGTSEALLQFVDEDLGRVVATSIVHDGDAAEAGWQRDAAAAPGDTCAHVRQRDLRGAWLESDTVCADVAIWDSSEPPPYCGTGAGAPAMIPAALALFASLRRRSA